MRRLGSLVILVVLCAVIAPGAARATVDPWSVVGGGGSKWFSGSLIQQIGENCSVLGSPYTEVMVSGVGSYGGAPGNGVVKVNDPYWVALMVAIPGNPCGSGSSSVVTDLVFPKNTAYDSSRQIRCFGTPRNQPDNLLELTNENWSHLGFTGRYCPTGPTVAPIGKRFGYRPLANGQFFWIFVPVKSTSTLAGIGGPDEFNWLTTATGVYANPDRSQIWANVFPASSAGQAPYVYFANTPAANPFWCAICAAGTQNRVEFFVNAYTAGFGGNLHYEIRRTDNNALVATDALDGGYSSLVSAGLSLVQVQATGANLGPNGGYVPFYYDPLTEWDAPMKITWDFAYTDGTLKHATGVATFRTLAGPNDQDQCNVPPPLPSGCTLPPLPKLSGSVDVKKNAKLKRSTLAVGQKLALKCNLASKATAALTLSKSVAKSLGLATKIGSGSAQCNADGKTLKLKLTAKAAKKLKGKKPGATLTITFTRKGSKTFKFVRPVKIA